VRRENNIGAQMTNPNGLTADEISEQANNTRFLALLKETSDPLVAIQLLACEIIEIKGFVRKQNHNSTAAAERIGQIERDQRIANGRIYALIGGLYLILLGMLVGQQPAANSLLLQLLKLILGQP
jgi:hypothetical protein